MVGFILILFILLFFILLLIGIISPKVGLFWLKGQRTRLKSISIYTVLIVCSCGIIAILNREPTLAAEKVSAEYYENSVRADMKYRESIIKVEGRVYMKYYDTTHGQLVIFIGGWGGHTIMCGFKDENKASKLADGCRIQFSGVCGGMDGGTLTFGDCDFIKVFDKDIKKEEDYPEIHDTAISYNIISQYTEHITATDFMLNTLHEPALMKALYEGKKIIIAGKIDFIQREIFKLDKNAVDEYSITMWVGKNSFVSCVLTDREKILSLSQGDAITISGTVGKIGVDVSYSPYSINITDCKIVE